MSNWYERLPSPDEILSDAIASLRADLATVRDGRGIHAIVCGGRDWTDGSYVAGWLDAFNLRTPVAGIIEGGQRKVDHRTGETIGGADYWAKQWAISRSKDWITISADWTKLGKRAGPVRNGMMLKHKPDMVIAFPGGRGTLNMIGQAHEAGVRVIQVALPPLAQQDER